MIRAFALTLTLCLVSLGAQAQSTIHYGDRDRLDPGEVARILDAPARKIRTRSLRLLDDSPAAAPQPAAPTALSIPVRFAFDSAAIQPAARDQLDALAEGIKLLPTGRQVVVEGHTDAVGSDEYNADLSLRRAMAVRTYLVQVHGIEADRLHPAGAGKTKPIDGLSPTAAENRRVQFHGR